MSEKAMSEKAMSETVSFELMAREKVTRAFAFDRHFETAGFALLR